MVRTYTVPDLSGPMQVKVKKLSENAVVPKYAKAGDAGLDLVATSYEYVNGRHVYGTDLAIEIPEGYVGLIFPRSSICKYDLRLTNSVGVIDSGYRGEIKFQFENAGFEFSNMLKYKIGDRIGQLLILPYPQIELVEAEELSTTERGEGGFGHSGK
jgi:dUTP pyrophosphatase